MKSGFVALYTVLIVLVVVLVVAGTVAMLSIGQAQGTVALGQGEGTLSFVEGCVEDGLLKARAAATFGDPVGGNVSITRPEGTCSVVVNSKVGNVWTMTVTNSTNTTYSRTIQVVFNRAGSGISGLTSWREQ